MKIAEREAKASFDQKEQEIVDLRARLQILKAEQEKSLQKNEVMAIVYRIATFRVKAMGQTLAG